MFVGTFEHTLDGKGRVVLPSTFRNELAGKGYGRWLMAMALQTGWAEPGIERMWVHTCTLDGPGALNFYVKSGFTPYQRQVETFPDPRLSGLIPREAAPQIPLIA